ncbi:MAG: protoporphyrinogen oxidase [Blastocatellia bacterium]
MKLDSIIIGAGLSGLVAAFRLKQLGRLKRLGRDGLLIESGARVGGVIHSIEADGFLIEAGPNSFRGSHELLDLIEELELTEELVTADPRAPAYVYSGGELHAVPMTPSVLVKTKLLSTSAKLRLLREPFAKSQTDGGEESIASFVSRRLGSEVLEKLVAPFLSGVYAGDPERLSVQACFPKLAEFEAEAGSILFGALKTAWRKQEKPKRSLRPYRLCSFRHGLEVLPQRLAKELGESLLTEARVTNIRQSPTGYDLTVEHHGESQNLSCASLIVAIPAFAAAELLESVAPEIAGLLAEIPYASLASVPLAYRVEQVARQLDGFGFLIPRSEKLRTLGSIWNSFLFAERAPAGWVLTNNFIGGATDAEAVKLSDAELIQTVHRDLSEVLGITGEPKPLPITRYQRAIPQYELGHAARVAKLEAALSNHCGLCLVGNYLRGVSLGDCVSQAERLAAEIFKEAKSE